MIRSAQTLRTLTHHPVTRRMITRRSGALLRTTVLVLALGCILVPRAEAALVLSAAVNGVEILQTRQQQPRTLPGGNFYAA
jgi:hypothetical protein